MTYVGLECSLFGRKVNVSISNHEATATLVPSTRSRAGRWMNCVSVRQVTGQIDGKVTLLDNDVLRDLFPFIAKLLT